MNQKHTSELIILSEKTSFRCLFFNRFNIFYHINYIKELFHVKVHIPQELRIRSGGTERHSASN